MQIFNNQSNINFNGAFRIKPAEIRAQAEIPTLFTQGIISWKKEIWSS